MQNEQSHNDNSNQRLAWGLRDAAEACGVSVPYLRKKIASNEIRPTRAGRRVLIADRELRRFLGLSDASANEQAAA
jgi:excisionase family DNA binding protein